MGSGCVRRARTSPLAAPQITAKNSNHCISAGTRDGWYARYGATVILSVSAIEYNFGSLVIVVFVDLFNGPWPGTTFGSGS